MGRHRFRVPTPGPEQSRYAEAQELTIITPVPAVAVEVMATAREIILIGSRLSESRGIAIGAQTEREIVRCAVEVAVIGACSSSAGQGLGADDFEEPAYASLEVVHVGQ